MDPDLLSISEARAQARRARVAFEVYRRFDQAAADRITHAVVEAGYAASETLARDAVEETGIGHVAGKTSKNRFATRGVWARIRDMTTCGVIREDPTLGIVEVADPFGVVAAIIPTTNPTSTALFKAIICLKSRNAVVVSPHPRAVRCIRAAVDVCARAAVSAGAPEGLLSCMEHVSLEGTQALMKDPNVDLILATGGAALVRAAYSSGKPAFGVGPGNVPVYIDRSADAAHAARCIVESQSLDYGTICSSEQALVVDRPVAEALLEELRARRAHICSKDEVGLLDRLVYRDGHANTEIVGLAPVRLAELAGFSVPLETTLLVAPYEGSGPGHPLSYEKLCPIVAFYRVDGWEAGCHLSLSILNLGGRGHTLGLHCEDRAIVNAFALEKPVNRLIVNSPTSLGAVGFTTHLFPSMTLGCGSFGGNITSDNVGPQHLLNIKRVAWARSEYREGRMDPEFPFLPPRSRGSGDSGVLSPWEAPHRAPRVTNPAALARPNVDASVAGVPLRALPGENFGPDELQRVIRDALGKTRSEACPFGAGDDCRN